MSKKDKKKRYGIEIQDIPTGLRFSTVEQARRIAVKLGMKPWVIIDTRRVHWHDKYYVWSN